MGVFSDFASKMVEAKKKKIVKIRVPATASNLGPGYDCFAMAVKLYATVTVEITGDDLSFVNVPAEYCNEDNLVCLAYSTAMRHLRMKPEPGLRITIESDIPIGRGLGSSAALLVAGAKAASMLHGDLITDEGLISIANSIDGHPDNVSAAVKGGFVTAIMEDGFPYAVNYPIHKSLHTALVIADYEISNAMARSVLPKATSYTDAVYNMSHATLLIKALETGDAELINAAMRDRLYQPYRKKMIKEFDQVEEAAQDLGAISYTICGSGPAQLVVFRGDSEGFSNQLRKRIAEIAPRWQVLPTDIDFEGVTAL